MNRLLQNNQSLQTETSKSICRVEKFIASGGQGEVYEVSLAGAKLALKWYHPGYCRYDNSLRQRLEKAIETGAPTESFLWPLELVSLPGSGSFGYLMPLREQRFESMTAILRRTAEPSWFALTTAGFQLAHNFLQLHSKGMCYRDISAGNVFLAPDNGDVCICDNDNVDVNKRPGAVLGTPLFMAPEIVRREALPSRDTDLYSLSVLLFYLFFIHHPLEGRRVFEDFPDDDDLVRYYGAEPIFVFHPNDDSNRPIPGLHDNAISYWNVYPRFIKRNFVKAFTHGLNDANARIQETEWRRDLMRLRDSIFICSTCKMENFYDGEQRTVDKASPQHCWSCRNPALLPARIRIANHVVMLNKGSALFPHHVDPKKAYDFTSPIAKVTQHPKNSKLWGLRNKSQTPWHRTMPDGRSDLIAPGESAILAIGTRLDFGQTYGEIRM